MLQNNKSKRTKAQVIKIRRADGKVVGEVRGDEFYKRIHDRHFLELPPGIASDAQALRDAEAVGAKTFHVFHVEGRRHYFAPIARFWRRGFPVNRGHGKQVGLVLEDFGDDDNASTPTNKLIQLPLFNLTYYLR